MDLASACKVFSTVFGIAYFVAFYFSWSPFLYYPEQGTFHIAQQLPSAGPPILWYGWLTVATVVSGVVAIVPAQLVRKLPPAVFWVVPALVLLVVFFYEKRWFL